MKVQIQRLSPHQNGKVVAVLMVVVSLPLFVLMALVMWFGGPQVSQHGTAPASILHLGRRMKHVMKPR